MNYSKVLETKKKYLIAGILMIILSLAAIIGEYVYEETIKSNSVQDYHVLISKDEDEENKYASVVITDIPYGFAYREGDYETLRYYLVYDKDNYMYMARLTDATYKNIEKMYEESNGDFSYELKGYLYKTPDDLKDIAIDFYNSALEDEEDKITQENFHYYLGKTYLDETQTPTEDLFVLVIIFGTIFTILGIVCIIIHFVRRKKRNKILKEYNRYELESELSSPNTKVHEKENIYLTDKYIISSQNGLDIIKYEDILWIYNEKIRQNRVNVGVYLVCNTKFKKRIMIAFSRKEEKIIDIIEEISDKNGDILVGYTKENKKLYKDKTSKNK